MDAALGTRRSDLTDLLPEVELRGVGKHVESGGDWMTRDLTDVPVDQVVGGVRTRDEPNERRLEDLARVTRRQSLERLRCVVDVGRHLLGHLEDPTREIPNIRCDVAQHIHRVTVRCGSSSSARLRGLEEFHRRVRSGRCDTALCAFQLPLHHRVGGLLAVCLARGSDLILRPLPVQRLDRVRLVVDERRKADIPATQQPTGIETGGIVDCRCRIDVDHCVTSRS